MNELYRKVTFADLYDPTKTLVGYKDESSKESGVIFANYTPVIESNGIEFLMQERREYKKVLKEYHLNHALCPKCGAKGHSTTYMGYIINTAKKDEYKDLNRCVCSECGDVHTTHDRVKLNDNDVD